MKMHNQQAEHVVFRGRVTIFARVSLLGFGRTRCSAVPRSTYAAFTYTMSERKFQLIFALHARVRRASSISNRTERSP
jgi:hypothetical protein